MSSSIDLRFEENRKLTKKKEVTTGQDDNHQYLNEALRGFPNVAPFDDGGGYGGAGGGGGKDNNKVANRKGKSKLIAYKCKMVNYITLHHRWSAPPRVVCCKTRKVYILFYRKDCS